LSKKRQGSKIKKVSVLRPEDMGTKPQVMGARPPRPIQGHTRAQTAANGGVMTTRTYDMRYLPGYSLMDSNGFSRGYHGTY